MFKFAKSEGFKSGMFSLWCCWFKSYFMFV